MTVSHVPEHLSIISPGHTLEPGPIARLNAVCRRLAKVGTYQDEGRAKPRNGLPCRGGQWVPALRFAPAGMTAEFEAAPIEAVRLRKADRPPAPMRRPVGAASDSEPGVRQEIEATRLRKADRPPAPMRRPVGAASDSEPGVRQEIEAFRLRKADRPSAPMRRPVGAASDSEPGVRQEIEAVKLRKAERPPALMRRPVGG
ncbi:hypothetical protein M2319_004522 [Rhodobium gokarnense]|uniref:Uncharacterized protein n=1 Tax=Rhodobium gokarnense TaxID=364296 RepID=A0ABT3HIR6_9HYPH|nr:hypothetical protein [Rhodobium gokarnense]